MIFSYNWLKEYVEKLPAPEKLAELLTLHSFEVEEVKRVDQDWTLNIDILPNRAGDCLSHMGLARESAILTNSKFQIPNSKQISNHKSKTDNFIAVEVKAQQVCPRYAAITITDVEVGTSPKWLKDRLEICGLNSINNIVDAVNYVMLETGQPLHAFDARKLEGNKIIVRFAKEGESIVTLDNQKFGLDDGILVVADGKKPVAIAGIKGGKAPEISAGTKIVLLEAANFDPLTVRKASRKLALRTDASLRFEHGLDRNLTDFAINRAASLIQKLAGGKIAQETIDIYLQKTYPRKIKLDLAYVENLLGAEISPSKIVSIFKKLGFRVLNPKSKILNVEIPTWRQDISIPEDLIEEAARIWGHEMIPASFPASALIPAKRNDEIFWGNMAKDTLKELGFAESYNYSFVAKGDKAVEVKNPISGEFGYLRQSLIPNLLKNVDRNIKLFRRIKIFEMGKIFSGIGGEKTMLSGITIGEDFYQLKGNIDTLLNELGIGGVWYDQFKPSPEDSPESFWQAEKCAEIKVGNAEIGFLGELKQHKGVMCFDLDFEKLSKLVTEEYEYKPISRYPATIRDLAILVPLNIRVEEVLNKIEMSGGPLVVDVDLFDIYEGEELPQGMKNLAFRIVYQASDRTLTSKEVDKIHQKIIKTLEKDPLWQVRK